MVSNGKDVGIYTNWTQASDSVLGFANARYKGYTTYSEAKRAMESAGISEFHVFDGQQTLSKKEYEKQIAYENAESESMTVKDTLQNETKLVEVIYGDHVKEVTTVYIDGSCVRNGASSAKAGYGLYWGVDHPWNGSYTMSTEEGATNNKAELRAAIKAIEIARDNGLKELIVKSDSKYVILGITQWSDNWQNNGWKTSSGDSVKNKEEWKQLLQLVHGSNIAITWNHVPGHKGISGNEEADKLAVLGANNKGSNQKSTEETRMENSPVTQPKVIVIGKVTENQRKDTKIISEHSNELYPKRKQIKDNADTPVPGCVNGSYLDHNQSKGKDNKSSGKESQKSVETDVMKNMETVLETVLLGLNQSREDNFMFRNNVTKNLEEITSRQEVFAESLADIRKELKAESRDTNSRMEIVQASISMEDNLKVNQDISRKLEAMTSKQQCIAESQSTIIKEISSDKKNINSRFDGLKSTLHTVDMSCSDLKRNIEKASVANKKECDEIQDVGRKIYDAITDVRSESRRTREQVGDIEKSISAISEAGMFSTNTKSKKANENTKDSTPFKSQPEIESEKSLDTEEVELLLVEEASKTDKNSQKNTDPVKVKDSAVHSHSEMMNRQESQQGMLRKRKEKVYLIGDSLAGQINVPLLGKATDTYVRRLRAPKIDDIGAYKDELKDAKLIIIHTGVNNIRDKESTEACANSMVTAITDLKSTAKDAKIAVSKIAPVGDRELSIESSMLNASCEKKLSEIHQDIHFIDHSNLAEQGSPVKKFYRPDMIHLSNNGVITFGTNLKRVINKLLNHKEEDDEIREVNKLREGRSTVQGRKYWGDETERSDRPYANRGSYGQYDNTKE